MKQAAGRRRTIARMTDAELLKEIDAQRLLMIAVSTQQGSIDSKNPEYIERRERIRVALRDRSLGDPNEYDDLWAWYGKWSSGDLPKWQQRREYVSALYKPLTEMVRSGGRAALPSEPTGWTKVDAIRRDIAVRVAQAKSEHDYQGVGHLCREVLIALAEAVYDLARHPPTDGVVPSTTDAKRKLDAYLAVELPGSGNAEARKSAKSAVDLANAVQHRQGATLRDAALAAEAANGVINAIAIIAGHRDKPLESIREELAERLARAEAEAASSKEKYEATAGFSAVVSLEGTLPGGQHIRVQASQAIELLGVDYCLADGARVAADDTMVALRGRDVRVPINHECVIATFHEGRRGTSPGAAGIEVVSMILRVRLRAGEVFHEKPLSARAVHQLGSSDVGLSG
jgi:hypothetical protein